MEKNFNIIAKDLFGKIRTQFPSIKLGDKTSKVTSDPSSARFFEFEYEQNGNNLGTITISLSEEGMAVMYTAGMLDELDEISKSKWFKFLRSLRDFAKQHLLNFDTRDITKSNLEKRDYETLATRYGESQMAESKLWGSTKISYQDIGESRLIVKHSKPVNSEVPAGRARNIESIYVENSQGERFKYPYKHLSGARAMARHVANGGTPYDTIGEHLVGLSEELGKLRMFKGYVDRNEMVSEAMSSIQPKVLDRINEIKKEIVGMQSQKYYESFVESFEDLGEQQIPEEVMNDWIDRLTIRTFNEELKNVFPYIFKLVSENDLPVKEVSFEELVKEDQEDQEDQESAVEGTDLSFSELTEYEEMLSAILEKSNLLSNNEAESSVAIEKLNSLLSTEFPVGPDASNATESLKDVIDDKELFDIFKELADVNPQFDVRPILQDYIRIKDEENGTDILSQLNFGEEAPVEQPVPAEQPVPPEAEIPAEVPADQPQLVQNSIGESFEISEESNRRFEELKEFIGSMYNREEGTFPKGETGVLLACEKKFGERVAPIAAKMVERMSMLGEMKRMKKLSGMDEDKKIWIKDKTGTNDPMSQKIGATRARDNKNGRMTPDDQEWGKKRVKDLSRQSTKKMQSEPKPNLPEELEAMLRIAGLR